MSSPRHEILAEGVELWCGDMLDILPTLGEFDACVTDPPYGIGEHGGKLRTRLRGRARETFVTHDSLGWDNETPTQEAFDLIREKTSQQVIWGGNYFADMLPASSGWFYWQKLQGGDFSDGELAWTNRKKALREFTFRHDVRSRLHPTQKPVELMSWCIDQLPSDVGTILDPFMGSGTTGVAAIKRGKAFYGIEREPKYFEIALRRISEALKSPDMFIPTPAPKPIQEPLL